MADSYGKKKKPRKFQFGPQRIQSDSINNDLATPGPVTEKQLEKLMTFLLSVNRCYYENEEIMDIVSEETGAFFAGDKTAEETANVIQNRVQLYLDTNMK